MTMVLPLSHGSCPDVFPMPCGFDGSEPVDFDAVESSLASSEWIMPSALPALDAGLGYTVAPVQDSNNNTKEITGACPMATGLHEAPVDWPLGATKRKAEETPQSEPELCGLFFQPAKRLSLVWNTKLRLKEERKRVLKLSITKLRQIDDPELFLRRSVLINNTIKRLHREIREEKLARLGRPRHSPDSLTSCALEPFPRRRTEPMDSHPTPVASPPLVEQKGNVADDPLCKRLRTESQEETPASGGAVQQRTLEPMSCSDSTGLTTLGVSVCNSGQHGNLSELTERPPAITKTEAVCDTKLDSRYDYGVPYSSSRERIVSDIEKQYSGYSCGQSSIFGELQSVVFHSLIASLES